MSDSYFDTNEVMFSFFVQGIEKIFKKDIRHFKCATLKAKDIHAEYLEDYLIDEQMPFFARGFDIPNMREIPVRVSLECKRGNRLQTGQCYGFYNIFPDTDNELFIYFCESSDFHSEAVAFAAYRRIEVLGNILHALKKYYAKANNVHQKVFLHGTKELMKDEIYWDDIILPEMLKKDLKLCIENFLRGKHIYRERGIPYKRGLLFTGTPGNGKTMLCKVIACESSLPFILFTFGDESMDYDIERVFEKAEELSPALLCFEDLDSIGNSRQTLGNFLNKLDRFEPLDGILILATTNKPEEIDPALCNRPSRFDRIFRIPNPDYHCRLLMIKKYTGNLFIENTLKEIASETDDFSMAHLKELYIYSVIIAMEKGFAVPSEEDMFEALETLKYRIKNGCKPLDKKLNEVSSRLG